jgi:hypothetical protein
MARIREYTAENVKIEPSNAGYSAYEMAGRRIGPFYGQTAQGQRQTGQLQAEEYEAQGKTTTSFLRFRGLEGAGSLAVKYGGGLTGGFGGFGGEGSSGNNYYNARANYSNMTAEEKARTLGETSRGAAGYSRLARNLVSAASPAPAQDVENGVTVLRGGNAAPRVSDIENGVTVLRGGGGPAPGPQYGGEAVSSLGQPTLQPTPSGMAINGPMGGGPIYPQDTFGAATPQGVSSAPSSSFSPEPLAPPSQSISQSVGGILSSPALQQPAAPVPPQSGAWNDITGAF